MGTFEGFEDIEVWQKARLLSNEIFELTKTDSFSEDRNWISIDRFKNLYDQLEVIDKMIQGL